MRVMREIWDSLDQRVKNRFLSVAGVCVLVAFCLFVTVAWPRISGKPDLTLNGEEEITISAGEAYHDEGASATLAGKNVDSRIYESDNLDTSTPGTYEISYHVDGRWETYTVTRTVRVVDTTAPEIVLNGDSRMTVDQIETYEEPGAVATDNCDGDLSDTLSIHMAQVNEYTYQVTYEASDLAGNAASVSREVIIRDQVAPEISLVGDASVTIQEREKFDDPGAVASDDRDGDLTDSVSRDGYVDIYRPGTYTVTYTVEDGGGNQAQVSRTVCVERVHQNPDNAIYLTFDDGPSPDVTAQILDILAENHVKATFFICNYDEETLPLIRRMIAEGHTVGIHGYSHQYSQIYSSADAFMNNINDLKDKLKADTGYDAFCIRFPGGSGNTVSAYYTEGIMSELVELVTDADLMYVDWNVASGDAEGSNTPVSEILANVKSELKLGRTNIVLMHDTSAKQTTADALQKIIDYGRENGFEFYPIEENTVPIHQSVLN
ncbi:MAG: polysaccharide deacetylase family protein [Lachnospiraceae bacterium]|nr:polysaccharide deacetylase family protein [Lachnospiraceae bacterium]